MAESSLSAGIVTFFRSRQEFHFLQESSGMPGSNGGELVSGQSSRCSSTLSNSEAGAFTPPSRPGIPMKRLGRAELSSFTPLFRVIIAKVTESPLCATRSQTARKPLLLIRIVTFTHFSSPFTGKVVVFLDHFLATLARFLDSWTPNPRPTVKRVFWPVPGV